MKISTAQEAINGNSNDTVITPLRLKQVLSNMDIGGGGSGGVTKETDPVFKSSPAGSITTSDVAKWNAKQEALVSGQNIKTINGQDILGNGDIVIESDTQEVAVGPSTPTSGEKVWFQPIGNLFNKGAIVDGGRLLNDGNVHTWNNDCCCSDFIEVQPNTQYTLSGGTKTSGATIPYYNCYYDENKNCIGSFSVASGVQTITTPVNAKYMRFTVYNVDKNTFQFEKGSVATAYKPYSPKQSINVLNGQTYEEFLNVDNLLTKDDNIIIEEKDPTVPAHVKAITQEDIDNWNRGTGGSGVSIDQIYPVGSIYISASATVDPNVVFTGTQWERFANGKTLIGVDEEDTDFATVGLEGGSKDAVVVKHSHSVTGEAASAGAHTHTVSATSAKTTGTLDNLCETWNNKTQDRNGSTSSSGAHTHTVTGTAGEVGEDGTGKNLQPFITVFIWKRVA